MREKIDWEKVTLEPLGAEAQEKSLPDSDERIVPEGGKETPLEESNEVVEAETEEQREREAEQLAAGIKEALSSGGEDTSDFQKTETVKTKGSYGEELRQLVDQSTAYQDVFKEEMEWSEHGGGLGQKLEKFAKRVQMVGGIGGGVVATGGAYYAGIVLGGAILTNPITAAALGVVGASVIVGEVVKMYRRNKELKFDQKRRAIYDRLKIQSLEESIRE